MRILITNDDGFHAKGISVLKKIALELTDDVWVCAPETEQSAQEGTQTESTETEENSTSDNTNDQSSNNDDENNNR